MQLRGNLLDHFLNLSHQQRWDGDFLSILLAI